MTPDPFDILGVPSTASVDDARAAFRKLASKHHPDHGGDTKIFVQVREAFNRIEGGYTRSTQTFTQMQARPQYRPSSGWTKPEPAYSMADDPRYAQFYRKPSQAYKQAVPKINPYRQQIVEAYKIPEVTSNVGAYVARVSIADAYNGFVCEVAANGTKYRVNVPPGVPHGLDLVVSLKDKDVATLMIRFNQSVFQFIGTGEAVRESVIANSEPAVVLRTKDLRMVHEMTARECGRTIELIDFLGEKFKVSVPAAYTFGGMTKQPAPIKVEGRGYVDWFTSHSKAGSVRGDLYITIRLSEIEDPVMYTTR